MKQGQRNTLLNILGTVLLLTHVACGSTGISMFDGDNNDSTSLHQEKSKIPSQQQKRKSLFSRLFFFKTANKKKLESELHQKMASIIRPIFEQEKAILAYVMKKTQNKRLLDRDLKKLKFRVTLAEISLRRHYFTLDKLAFFQKTSCIMHNYYTKKGLDEEASIWKDIEEAFDDLIQVNKGTQNIADSQALALAETASNKVKKSP